MSAQRPEGPGENGAPIPRDLPDQQADGGEDRWDVGGPDPESGRSDESGDSAQSAPDVPDTDEAGTGRQGAPHAERGQSDHPVPEEPSA
ncbi:hypothetical protein J2X68_004820 [Streptomyces sp. 3330]|uniref:hypothetical protein n=1 Tax=Streptomyces sp. 3330 TaxID=2817755 RepID=UPI00285930D8|nr:hypothetical protein [Streptomyces sp. 3330]MDR6978096.1 hypothetical protein [Streptomyces sp. 3330]